MFRQYKHLKMIARIQAGCVILVRIIQGERMERIRRLAQYITEDPERKLFFDYVVDAAVEGTGAERGLLVTAGDSRISVASARNVDQENLRGREARLSMSIARECIEQNTTILLEDPSREKLFSSADSVFELGLRSVLCVPVWLQGTVIAALYVDSRFIPGAFGQKDALLLETIADITSIHYLRTRQLEREESILNDLQTRTKALENLQEQLKELNALSAPARSSAVMPGGTEEEALSFPPLIGKAPVMKAVYAIIKRVLGNEITVLITGESGTGKELVARAIYEYGRRKDKPFVAINCSSIPANLIESELFGHTRGAFTGATRDKKGLFEAAHTGTLFLDEVGDMPLEMQGKLLRALQYGEIQRLGNTETTIVDVRVIAATNRNLEERVAQGAFREDLYYRLNIVSIEAPPLRQRKDDIPLLVRHFMKDNHAQGLTTVTDITPQALLALRKYPWPGNVRELETVLKSACLFAEEEQLGTNDFEGLIRNDSALLGTCDPSYYEGRTMAEIERDVIMSTLKKNSGNKKRTALELGIDRRTLYNKLKRYGYQFT
jgi:transcriptional regulator with GAF, ATPase, and Fis domain